MTTASQWARFKARKAELRAKGICVFRVTCGKPAKAGGMCLECRARWKDEQRRCATPWVKIKAKKDARRAAGLCCFNLTCEHKPFRAGLCRVHWKKHRATQKSWFDDMYHAKKSAGLCVTNGCKEDATAGTGWCERHRAEKRERERQANAKNIERRRASWRASAKRVRSRREELGQCVICKGPAVTRQLCEKHREQRCEISKRNTKRKTDRVWRCSLCHEPGHYAPRCKNVRDSERVDIEEIATRGLGAWAA